jgi:hypothetical protein
MFLSWLVLGQRKSKRNEFISKLCISSVILNFCFSVFLSLCLSVLLSICLSVFFPSLYLSSCLCISFYRYLSLCFSVYLFLCLHVSVSLFLCLSVSLYLCLPVFLFLLVFPYTYKDSSFFCVLLLPHDLSKPISFASHREAIPCLPEHELEL